jgi:hypothetical protein
VRQLQDACGCALLGHVVLQHDLATEPASGRHVHHRAEQSETLQHSNVAANVVAVAAGCRRVALTSALAVGAVSQLPQPADQSFYLQCTLGLQVYGVHLIHLGTYLLPHAMSSTAGCVASVWGTSTQLKREVLAMLAHLQ